MSVNAGNLITVSGRTVLQRVQSSGLGTVRIPVDTIREVGNDLVVDKVPTEPDFTFTLESLDVSCDIEAILQGKTASGASGAADADPTGTEYAWANAAGRAVNFASPWKSRQTSASAGVVVAGHVIPGYYPTRIRYQFGVTDNATTTAELAGGSYYEGKFAPIEEVRAGDGATTNFVTANAAVRHRKGGVQGTTFRAVFGVLVDGVVMVEGEDFTTTGGGPASAASAVTISFNNAPANGVSVRFMYFTTAAQSYPKSVHKSAVVLPGAVRGRNICVSIASGGAATWQRLPNIQTTSLEATVASDVERELCNEEQVGRTVNGIDCSGDVVYRGRDADAVFETLKRLTGVDTAEEVLGFINTNPVQLKIEIQNPKNPGTVIKTLYVSDAQFDIPDVPARVNTPVDFTLGWQSQSGTYSAFKGAMG
jgi:hypothetical protein